MLIRQVKNSSCFLPAPPHLGCVAATGSWKRSCRHAEQAQKSSCGWGGRGSGHRRACRAVLGWDGPGVLQGPGAGDQVPQHRPASLGAPAEPCCASRHPPASMGATAWLYLNCFWPSPRVRELLASLPCRSGTEAGANPRLLEQAVPGPSQRASASPLGRSAGVRRGRWPMPPWAPGGSPVCRVGQRLLHGTSRRARGHAPTSAGTLLGGWCQAMARCGVQLCGTWPVRAV